MSRSDLGPDSVYSTVGKKVEAWPLVPDIRGRSELSWFFLFEIESVVRSDRIYRKIACRFDLGPETRRRRFDNI